MINVALGFRHVECLHIRHFSRIQWLSYGRFAHALCQMRRNSRPTTMSLRLVSQATSAQSVPILSFANPIYFLKTWITAEKSVPRAMHSSDVCVSEMRLLYARTAYRTRVLKWWLVPLGSSTGCALAACARRTWRLRPEAGTGPIRPLMTDQQSDLYILVFWVHESDGGL